MTLSELKAQAQSLGLSKEFIAQHGDLRRKATWQNAIASHQEQMLKDEIAALHEQESAIWKSESEPKPFFSTSEIEKIAAPDESEAVNITPTSHPESLELLQPPTDPEFTIAPEPLKLPNKSALYDHHWIMIGDWVKLDEFLTCQVTHVLAEDNVEVQVEETGEVLNVIPARLRHLTEAELDEVDSPEFAIVAEPEVIHQAVTIDLNTYEVITEEPPTPVHTFIPSEQDSIWLPPDKPKQSKQSPPKLPFQDFFTWLFSPPNPSEATPLELELNGRI